jgi:hypothetical protein
VSNDISQNLQFLIGAERRQQREEQNMNQLTRLHNRGMVDIGREAFNRLSAWLTENPVIENPDSAREANDVLEGSLLVLKDIEAERTEQTEPLNKQLSSINAVYRAMRDPLQKATEELKRRLTRYVAQEEAARIAEANRLKALAEEAEQRARAAERAEQDAIAAVDVGACEDVGSAIEQADAAFSDFERAQRAAVIAERDVTVRLRSRFGNRARTMRNTEVLEVTNAAAAIAAMGVTSKIAEAIMSSAREYRKAHGSLPPGVVGKSVRSL